MKRLLDNVEIELLFAIKNNSGANLQQISYSIQRTHSHLHIVKRNLLKMGLVASERKGRQCLLTLTKKGEEVIVLTSKLNRCLNAIQSVKEKK